MATTPPVDAGALPLPSETCMGAHMHDVAPPLKDAAAHAARQSICVPVLPATPEGTPTGEPLRRPRYRHKCNSRPGDSHCRHRRRRRRGH